MEKIIKVGEYEFAAKSNAASLFSYKANFGRDGMRDLMALSKNMQALGGNEPNYDSFDGDVFFRFLWVFARSADHSIPPIEQWLEQFDVAPLDFMIEVLPQMLCMISSTIQTTVTSKNPHAAVKKK